VRPGREIAAAADHIPPGPLVGHCSARSGSKCSRARAFASPADDGHGRRGVRRAAARRREHGPRPGRRPRLCAMLGMRPVEIRRPGPRRLPRAASVASNFLVTLEAAAERIGSTTGAGRDSRPLVRATVETGPRRARPGALTGPIARATRPRCSASATAVAARAPDLLPLFERRWRTPQRRLARRPAPRRRCARSAPSPSCAARSPARARPGGRISLVPTMGRSTRATCRHPAGTEQAGRRRRLAFVNPPSSGPGETSPPTRDEARDAALVRGPGSRPAVRARNRGGLPRRLRHGVRVTGR